MSRYVQTSCLRGQMKIQKQTTAALRKRRQALLRQLPPLKAVLRGSLIERYKRCGKPGCKCARGPGHGPKYYLSVSYPSRPANGLCPARVLRTGERVPGQLPPRSPDLGGDLRDQPRAPTPSREALKDRHERSAVIPPRTDRSGTGRRAPRQYARQLARPQPQLDRRRGGQG